ncbi:MAG: cysteine desulfurase [Methylococcaceae bacterium]|nr:cysteine desulfurase [Methylococcaceae bacterium]
MVYLDHNATTPLDERVLEAMLPYLRSYYGNASGLYRLGRLSRGAVDTAREHIAALTGAHPLEVIFTSGGTEANNLALKGMAFAVGKGVLITGATEHPSVSEPLKYLAARGWTLKTLPVGPEGLPANTNLESPDIKPGEAPIGSLMLANNETGVIHDTLELASSLRKAGGFLHVDAVQAVGKIPVDLASTGAHTMTLSAHKIYGPKGVGALIAKRTAPIEPLLHGGGQERGLRGGTENVAGIVGFGKAAELARLELEARSAHTLALRRRLERGLRSLPGVTLFAETTQRLPNTVQFSVPSFDGETLVMNLDRLGFAVSSGSACASGGNVPSPVLTAMGVDAETARGAIRVSLGRGNTEFEVDQFMEALKGLLPSR